MPTAAAGLHPAARRVTLFVGSILLTNIVVAHRCYVCGPTNSISPFFKTETQPCDGFDLSDQQKFIVDCPPDSKGCSIQTNGSVVTRNCEDIAVDDCKVANHVRYCYCRTDLCNAYSLTTTRTDDEDNELEGSGNRNIDTVLTVPKVTVEMSTSTTASVTLDIIGSGCTVRRAAGAIQLLSIVALIGK